MKRIQLLFVFLLIVSVSEAQSTEAGWDLGVNAGFYMPSNYHAKFYSGISSNENNLDFIFNNKYRRDEISNLIGAEDTFYVAGIPQKMKYTPGFSIGIYFERAFNERFSLALHFNFAKLTATDQFTLHIDPNSIFTEEDIRLYDIWGVENRSYIDLIFSRTFVKSNNINPFVEFGFNFNSVEVKEHNITIEDQSFSLVNTYLNQSYVPGAQINQYDIKQGGLGYGVIVGGGIKLSHPSGVSIDPGLNIYISKINLENYNAIRPSFMFYVRLSLANYFAE